MTESTPVPESEPRIRRLLHDVNDELSIAVMQLEIALEQQLDADMREALQESLDACRKSAANLKEVWQILGTRREPPAAAG